MNWSFTADKERDEFTFQRLMQSTESLNLSGVSWITKGSVTFMDVPERSTWAFACVLLLVMALPSRASIIASSDMLLSLDGEASVDWGPVGDPVAEPLLHVLPNQMAGGEDETGSGHAASLFALARRGTQRVEAPLRGAVCARTCHPQSGIPADLFRPPRAHRPSLD